MFRTYELNINWAHYTEHNQKLFQIRNIINLEKIRIFYAYQ